LKERSKHIYQIQKKWTIIALLGICIWLAGILLAPLLADIHTTTSAGLYFLYQPACHQISDRSFLIQGHPLAVCIRCTAFYFAGLGVIIFYLFNNKITQWPSRVYIILALPAVLDFILEKTGLYYHNEVIRTMTGFLLGVVFFQILVIAISKEIKSLFPK